MKKMTLSRSKRRNGKSMAKDWQLLTPVLSKIIITSVTAFLAHLWRVIQEDPSEANKYSFKKGVDLLIFHMKNHTTFFLLISTFLIKSKLFYDYG